MQPGDQITKRRPCDEQWQTAGVDATCRDGTATEAALDAFLAGFAPAEVGVVIEAGVPREPTLAERAFARFVQRDGGWFLADGETSDQECKAQFDPRRMEPVVRAIAALANNRGGFVFIGVQDAECRVTGMPDTAFQDTDIVRITDKVKNLLTPTPAFSKDVIEVGGHAVGFRCCPVEWCSWR